MATPGGTQAAFAAKAAIQTIPIVLELVAYFIAAPAVAASSGVVL
jgi:hypothetical protein